MRHMATARDARGELLSFDWLGACRRAVEGLREVLADNPTSKERVIETGETGGGGDPPRGHRTAPEDGVFGELDRLHAAGARFTAVSEERGFVDFGSDEGTPVTR